MKSVSHLLLLITLLFALAGCGGGGSGAAVDSAKAAKGAITLSFDLESLTADASSSTAKSLAAATATPITSATVELSRSGYQSISQEMTIANNVASCRIDNLDSGYWHVVVRIFSDTVEIYTGSSDGNVLAGAVAQVNILFDPVVTTPTTGSLAITAGINPMPGYTVINQQISKALFDPAAKKLYIYDATTTTVGEYDADTLIRKKDYSLQAAPAAVALTANCDALLLGYSSGQIYKLNLASGAATLVGDVLMDVKTVTALDNRLALVSSGGSYQSNIKTMDLTTGQILNTKSYYYGFTDLVVSKTTGTAYGQHINVSPTDLFRMRVDLTTGTITQIKDSTYHGDYYLGYPLRLIKNDSRLVTASGNLFSTSSVDEQDLLYSGNLGFSFVDLAADAEKNKLYLLNNSAPYKLLILDQDTFFVQTTVELLGTPKYLFVTPTKIVVITSKDSVSYAKTLDKAALGL